MKPSAPLEPSLPALMESWNGCAGAGEEATLESCGVPTLWQRKERRVSDRGRARKVGESGRQRPSKVVGNTGVVGLRGEYLPC